VHYPALYSDVPSYRTKAFSAERVIRLHTHYTRMRDYTARSKHFYFTLQCLIDHIG
jgi:hypothetical protein